MKRIKSLFNKNCFYLIADRRGMIVTDMKRKSFILAILLIAIVGVWLSSSLSVANPIANNVESVSAHSDFSSNCLK